MEGLNKVIEGIMSVPVAAEALSRYFSADFDDPDSGYAIVDQFTADGSFYYVVRLPNTVTPPLSLWTVTDGRNPLKVEDKLAFNILYEYATQIAISYLGRT